MTGMGDKATAARDGDGTSANTGSGTAALSSTAGDHADFTFTGTAVSWISFRGPLSGIAEVWLDGVFMNRLDLYAPTETVRAPVFTATGLASGTHTLRINVTGAKNASASAALITVDASDVTVPASLPTVTRLQETDPAITYSPPGNWIQSSRYEFFSGEFAVASRTAGATATVRFTGTSVRWIGSRTTVTNTYPTGVARVSVDGVFVAQVDTLAAVQEEDQAALFTATGLPAGPHTLTIEVVGRNGEPPGATVDQVIVDAFDVY